ncbi:heterokaryon incompatibility protein-domain-containing protein [Tricladium varicosporioides]|nr:heterokaryon incompatibility protein-domain-containing protein [Hymenoscyphus varicosporioides]
MAPTDSFKYKDLESVTTIRLLRILPTPDKTIKCSLEHEDLALNPKYDCLSYTWGDPLFQKFIPEDDEDFRKYSNQTTFTIDIDGNPMEITENLHDALIQLGSSPHTTSGTSKRQDRIWIDALCINQTDGREKPHQIGMMSKIYHQAQNVVVWLGPEMGDDPGLETSLEVMDRLAMISDEKMKSAVITNLDLVETYEKLGIEPIDDGEWGTFAGFILRTWFGRMWVVQETFFAKNFIVLCGNLVLDWSKISAASKALKETRLGRLLNEKIERATGEWSDTSKYIGNPIQSQFLYTDIRETAKALTLERLLSYSRYFGATQAEDKVFAVLNMWKPEWAPSYDKGTTKFILENRTPVPAFTRATVVSIRETNDLNMLSLVEDRNWRVTKGLPSWVPDFSAIPVLEPLCGAPRAPVGEERWNASKDMPFLLPSEASSPLLVVDGYKIDEIVDFAETDLQITDNHQFYTLLELFTRFSSALTSNQKSSASDPFEPFWRTIIKDTYRDRPAGVEARRAFPMLVTNYVWELDTEVDVLHSAVEHAGDDPNSHTLAKSRYQKFLDVQSKTKAIVDQLSALPNSIVHTWDSMQKLIELGNKDELPEEEDRDQENIMDSFRSSYICRRLFRTKNNMLGLTAESMKVGDEVWVIAGSIVPMTLRKSQKGGNYELVGEAYVHGIMDGEAVVARKGEEAMRITLE